MQHQEQELGATTVFRIPFNGVVRDINTLKHGRIIICLIAGRNSPEDNGLVLLHECQIAPSSEPIARCIELVMCAVELVKSARDQIVLAKGAWEPDAEALLAGCDFCRRHAILERQ